MSCWQIGSFLTQENFKVKSIPATLIKDEHFLNFFLKDKGIHGRKKIC